MSDFSLITFISINLMIWHLEIAERIQNQNQNMGESMRTFLISMVAWSWIVVEQIKLCKTKFAEALPEKGNQASEGPRE